VHIDIIILSRRIFHKNKRFSFKTYYIKFNIKPHFQIDIGGGGGASSIKQTIELCKSLVVVGLPVELHIIRNVSHLVRLSSNTKSLQDVFVSETVIELLPAHQFFSILKSLVFPLQGAVSILT